MKRPDEATAAFKKALELDPAYYNCANRLLSLLSENSTTLKDAQILLNHMVTMAPYVNLQSIFAERTDLRQAWLDAQTPPAIPIKLEQLPLPFLPDPAKAAKSWLYTDPRIEALNGWTAQELLKDNAFASWISER